MRIIRPKKLTSHQKEDLMDLLADCRTAEPITLSIPEDADRFLLLYDGPSAIQGRCQGSAGQNADAQETAGQDADAQEAAGQDADAQETAGQNASVQEDAARSALASCLLICETPDDVWECYAFTRPRSRRKGYFSRLVDAACRMAEAAEDMSGRPIDLAFLSDQKSPQGLAAAEALGMTLWYSEHQMELDLGDPADQTLDPGFPTDRTLVPGFPTDQMLDPGDLTGQRPDTKADPRLLLRCETITEELEDGPLKSLLFSAYPSLTASASQRRDASDMITSDMATREEMASTAPAEDSPIGTCRLICYGPACFYLYHVEIRPDMRGKGWGKALLDALLGQLAAGSRIILQVSSLNAPALALYKKTGFGITETLSYYIF